jgi:hypothetical protein
MSLTRLLPGCLALAACVLGGAAAALAQTTAWVAVRDLKSADSICLEVTGNQVDYAVLGDRDAAHASVQGPRRLKVIARYLFADDDDDRVPYTLIVAIDGREVLRKRFTGLPLAAVSPCRGEQRAGSLRRAYVELPAGRHEVSLRAESEGSGQVAVRLFRQVRRQRESWVTFAPERFAELRHLQFDSGNQSVYYQFTADQPLHLSVIGPTTLRLSTRLDFDHTMNGTQQYSLQVLLDGEPWRTFHFDCIALTSAAYVERPDILPGVRKNLRVQVPRGRHTVDVVCVRPDHCSVATMVHIPKRDVQR